MGIATSTLSAQDDLLGGGERADKGARTKAGPLGAEDRNVLLSAGKSGRYRRAREARPKGIQAGRRG